MAVNIAQTAPRRNARQTMPRPERSSPVPPTPHARRRKARRHTRQQALKAGTQPPRSAPAGDVVLAYLRIQAGMLTSLEPQVRSDEFDSVHQMRVATRRLRATLRSFGQVIPRSRSEKLAAELKWLGGRLGVARDGEVIPGHLQAALRPTPAELLIGPVQARVQGYFAPRRASAREELIEALDGPRYRDLLAALDQLCHELPSGPRAGDPARDVLPAAVAKAYRQADKRMRRARHTPEGPAQNAALHQARKSARRARYAAEVTRPAAGRPAKTFARQMKKVQSVLGDHQDSVIARQAARDLGIGAHLVGENAFTYGLLHEREANRAAQLQAETRHVWRHAARRRYRRWLH